MRFLLPVLLLFSALPAAAQAVIVQIQGIDVHQEIAPRGIAVILGQNVADDEGNAVVTVNGAAALVLTDRSSSTEVVFQVPAQTAVGDAVFRVTAAGSVSAPFTYPVNAFAPVLADEGEAYHLDRTVIDEANPALPGETILVSGFTGLGAADPPQAVVTVGGLPVQIVSLQENVFEFFLPGVYTLEMVVPLGLSPGEHPGTITVGGVTFAPDGFLTVGGSALPTPSINSGGVVLANLLPTVASGSARAIMSAFGADFAPAGTSASAQLDSAGRVTSNLADTCMELNGRRSAMFLVTPGQLNFQASHAVTATGPVSAVVIRDCDTPEETRSAPVPVSFADVSPAFFVFNFEDGGGANPIAAQHGDFTPVGAPGLSADSTPAAPGELISLFGTGLGETDPPFEAGQVPGVGAQLVSTTQVRVRIGGIELAPEDIVYVGVAPCCAGLYQVVVRVPANAPDGDLPIEILINGISSPAGPFVAVARP